MVCVWDLETGEKVIQVLSMLSSYFDAFRRQIFVIISQLLSGNPAVVYCLACIIVAIVITIVITNCELQRHCSSPIAMVTTR